MPLRDPARGDGLLHTRDRPLGRLIRLDMGGDGATGVVVDYASGLWRRMLHPQRLWSIQ